MGHYANDCPTPRIAAMQEGETSEVTPEQPEGPEEAASSHPGELSEQEDSDKELEYLGDPYESQLDDSAEEFGAMRVLSDEELNSTIPERLAAVAESTAPTAFRNRTVKMGDRPNRASGTIQPVMAYMSINGVKALTLFDTGSTLDGISPDFARVANVDVFNLSSPVPIQLGTVGSRSKINYGANLKCALGDLTSEHYFDIINLDRYNACIGLPFMRRYGLSIDPKNNTVIIPGHASLLSLPAGEGVRKPNTNFRKQNPA
jgi:hypothetical protein